MLPRSLPEDALIDFMASSTLSITKLSITAKIVSCTLVSAVATVLSTSLRTILVKLLSNFCKSSWAPMTEIECVALLEPKLLQLMSALFMWVTHLRCVIKKSSLSLSYWLLSFPICCFFLLVDSIAKLTNEVNRTLRKIQQKNENRNSYKESNNSIWVFSGANCWQSHANWNECLSLDLLAIASSSLTSSSASN